MTSPAPNVDWLLDDLVGRVPGVQQATILSPDGLLLGSSAGLTREDAEHLAAVAAGMQSLARGASRRFGGGAVRQTVIEMDSAFLFVAASGQGACIAVISDGQSDLGAVAYEMTLLASRVGQYLASPAG
ncbi:MAG TPA: roadblock/LC7 domain-containing protein [Micromonosporaceae bacterium]|nr:roadblock/LC7 domain-containing protein [Micromonosporaceae bacterium]